ncbi:hypothetical protein [Sphingomonas radiodurans]|uniref:hypothetical protein n=1 Tax=Sphingomonas radiodurans TaxID=2890321 RepID=UPI001E298DA9|nr:hypothetical protein [Sphingomonas radiodurans]WBH15758.1 hypothetical protein LLW23_13160 [Sphingomonas radiodurans]
MRIEDLTDAELALRPHRIRGPVADFLLSRGAITSGRAIAYSPNDPAAHRDFARLRAMQVVRSTTDGRCWFDLRTYYTIQNDRERMRAMIAVPVAIIAAFVATLFYRG